MKELNNEYIEKIKSMLVVLAELLSKEKVDLKEIVEWNEKFVSEFGLLGVCVAIGILRIVAMQEKMDKGLSAREITVYDEISIILESYFAIFSKKLGEFLRERWQNERMVN